MDLQNMTGGEKLRAVCNMVRGNEFSIYNQMPEMALALQKRPGQVPDPKSGNGNTVFRINKNGHCYLNGHGYMDAIDVVGYIYNLSKMEAMDRVVEMYCGGWEHTDMNAISTAKPPEPQLSAEEIQKRKLSCRKMWQRSVPAEQSPEVINYLKGRGLSTVSLPTILRGVKKALYLDWDNKNEHSQPKKSWFGAMLGIYSDKNGQPISLHRIYVKGSGKAPVKDPKKIMSPAGDMRGGAIRLDEPVIFNDEHGPYGVLSLCEGIETGLAIREATALPVWACYSNTLLEQVVIPKGITQVIIWSDKDKKNGGQVSAQKLKARLMNSGIEVKVEIPPMEIPEGKKSVDWLDVLNQLGPQAFPWKATPEISVHRV